MMLNDVGDFWSSWLCFENVAGAPTADSGKQRRSSEMNGSWPGQGRPA